MKSTNCQALPLLPVGVLSLVLFAFVAGGLPVTVDETPYIAAGRSYADWLIGGAAAVASGDAAALARQLQARDDAYAINHEHPPLAKTVYGLCGRLFRVFGPLAGPRVGGLFFLLVLQVSLYFLIAPNFGRLAATAGALAVIAHPRIVAHAFTCGLDLPVAALSVLCALLFVRGLERRAAAVLCGVVWGLAMATKNNGVFLVVPLFLWGYLFDRRRVADNLFFMALLGPLTFVASWPWLWNDTFVRLIDYLRFHAQHVVEPSYFRGAVYAVHSWTYPLATLFAATPLVILAFAAVALARLRKRPFDPLVSLFAFLAVFAVLIVCPPSVPVYNGDRLFLLTEILLCGMAGVGLAAAAARLTAASQTPRRRVVVVAILGGVLLLPGLIGVAATHPYERSYYGALVGFRGGAMRLGFNPMEWSEVPPAAVKLLTRSFPQGLNLDNNSGAATVLRGYQQLGLLSPRFRFSDRAEYWLVEGNLAYSGFPRYWSLYYDIDPEYRLQQELGPAPHLLSLYKRTMAPPFGG
jgi:4-amino-4-deoxy-L-arabinose transferase-like glycosyltransferase